jgi:hypothetical protein
VKPFSLFIASSLLGVIVLSVSGGCDDGDRSSPSRAPEPSPATPTVPPPKSSPQALMASPTWAAEAALIG